MKRTPLFERHIHLGGKMIDFGGWELPVQYSGIIGEHQRVREAAGLFDVSHMGEIRVAGSGSTNFLQSIMTNEIAGSHEGQAVYSPMCYPDGGTVDDLLVYRFGPEEYLLVVNAINTEKDYAWLSLRGQEAGGVTIEDVSADYAQLALQGPESEAILQKLCREDLKTIGFFRFRAGLTVAGVTTLVSRSGYTGEDGFEIYSAPDHAGLLWDNILEAGREIGLLPAGLGARNTLRLEAALPLYGHELSADISPLEAGLERFVRLDKADFVGKEALLLQQKSRSARHLAGIMMLEPGIPRDEYEIYHREERVGRVTSGNFLPTLKASAALALIDNACAAEGTELDVIIRDRRVRGQVVGLPFYARRYRRR